MHNYVWHFLKYINRYLITVCNYLTVCHIVYVWIFCMHIWCTIVRNFILAESILTVTELAIFVLIIDIFKIDVYGFRNKSGHSDFAIKRQGSSLLLKTIKIAPLFPTKNKFHRSRCNAQFLGHCIIKGQCVYI